MCRNKIAAVSREPRHGDAWIEIEVEDGFRDAFVAWPEAVGRPPVLLLGAGGTPAAAELDLARRLCAEGYFVLAPVWTGHADEGLHEDLEGWLGQLASQRRVDDRRVGLVGFGEGADLALLAAGWRAERIAAVAALFGRGLHPAEASEIAARMNGLVHLGYRPGAPPTGMAAVEAAFSLHGVDFEVECYPWHVTAPATRLLELFKRTLHAPDAATRAGWSAPAGS